MILPIRCITLIFANKQLNRIKIITCRALSLKKPLQIVSYVIIQAYATSLPKVFVVEPIKLAIFILLTLRHRSARMSM